jgi:NodT family efflux transporter outer membrane factor (OMF) lipoprotein
MIPVTEPKKTPLSARVRGAFVPLFLFALLGCAVGPDYVRPVVPVPDAWHSTLPTGDKALSGNLSAWWATLDDRELSSLIDRALAGSLDLKKARAKVREARAQRAVALGGLFPTLDATASGQWTSSSGGSRSNGDVVVSGANTAFSVGENADLYNGALDASWEVDVFGGVRRSIEAAQGDLDASVENLRDVLVSLLAEVATNYADVRTYQARIGATRRNLKAQEETYRLTGWQYEAGLRDDLAVQQARYNLETTRSQIPALDTGLENAMNRIAVLLGKRPGAMHEELKAEAPLPEVPLQAAFGIPADLLRRRPDVRQAERQLAAQTARVGVAVADLYPKLTLSGSIGLEATSLSGFSSSILRTFTGGAKVSWPVFRGGTLRQKIEVQSALQEQALVQYEAKILTALEEVENALVAYAREQEKRSALRDGEEAARNAAGVAEQKFEAGLSGFVDVLDAQRSLLSFQDQLAQSNGAVVTNLIKLYKALGGGWESLVPSNSDESSSRTSAHGGNK